MPRLLALDGSPDFATCCVGDLLTYQEVVVVNSESTVVEQRPRVAREPSSESRNEGDGSQQASTGSRRQPRYPYSVEGHVRVEWLRLARCWLEAGAIYQAISAYDAMLECCAGTHAADVAAEELLELAQQLQQQGQVHAARVVLQKIENSYRD
jgi:hypothetical protein